MSLSYYYKLGFLTACADRGLGPEQAEALASQVLKQANFSLPILVPGIGAIAGAAMSPAGRKWQGAGHGAGRGLGIDMGAAFGSLGGAALGGLAGLGGGALADHLAGNSQGPGLDVTISNPESPHGSARIEAPSRAALGAAIGAGGGALAGIPAGGFLGYLLAKKMLGTPPWARPVTPAMPAPASVKAAFSPLGLAAGVVKAPLWLAGKAFQGAGNLGALAGIGAGSVLYGDPEEHLRPLSVRSPEAAARDSLARLRGMTDELRRRKAELVKNPGLFA